MKRASKLCRIKFSSSLFASHMSVSTNQLYQTNQIVLVCHIINILLTELSRSVWENLDLGSVYRPHCIRSVLTTSVKILPYRPPALLIRANYYSVHVPQSETELLVLMRDIIIVNNCRHGMIVASIFFKIIVLSSMNIDCGN